MNKFALNLYNCLHKLFESLLSLRFPTFLIHHFVFFKIRILIRDQRPRKSQF
jgi:hypothetical protein